jgi:hypothetical protein
VGMTHSGEVTQPTESVGTRHVSDRADTATGSDGMAGYLLVRGESNAEDVAKSTHLHRKRF